MKQIYKTVIVLLLFFSFFVEIKASGVTFSCDYEYDGIEFRIKVNNIDEKYVKSQQEITKATKEELEKYFIVFVLKDSGNFENTTLKNTIKDYKGYNDHDKKTVRIFATDGLGTNRLKNYRDFLKKAFESSSFAGCPNMYLKEDATNPGTYSQYAFIPNETDLDYDNTGTEVIVKHTPVNLKSTNCYNESGAAITCDLEKETNVRTDDNILECEYTTNRKNGKRTFKIIYYKDAKKAAFNSNGLDLELNSSYKSNEKDENGYYYINSEELINTLSGGTCKNIKCDCEYGHPCEFYTEKPDKACGFLTNNNGKKIDDNSSYTPDDISLDISDKDMNCAQILGQNLTSIVKLCVTIARIVGAVVTLIMGMTAMIPAISSGDQGALNKAFKKCITLAIILVIICLLPTFLKLIGDIAGFDLTCFF